MAALQWMALVAPPSSMQKKSGRKLVETVPDSLQRVSCLTTKMEFRKKCKMAAWKMLQLPNHKGGLLVWGFVVCEDLLANV